MRIINGLEAGYSIENIYKNISSRAAQYTTALDADMDFSFLTGNRVLTKILVLRKNLRMKYKPLDIKLRIHVTLVDQLTGKPGEAATTSKNINALQPGLEKGPPVL
jgi:hypothetical protein